MKHIKHYAQRLSHAVKKLYREELGIKLGLFATYADLLDKLLERGYWVELEPFHTFAYTDRMALLYKLWKRDENGCWKCIFDEHKDWSSDDGFGASFFYNLGEWTVHRIKMEEGL